MILRDFRSHPMGISQDGPDKVTTQETPFRDETLSDFDLKSDFLSQPGEENQQLLFQY